jgi:hypothetical protein
VSASPTTKALAKSLHTVTVIVAVARAEMDRTTADVHSAVHEALHILGYAGSSPDPYGLADKARAVLRAEVAA